MNIPDSRRKVIAKLFLNFASVIFGLLVIGPFVSGREINFLVFVVGSLLWLASSFLAVISEPVDSKEAA